MTLLAGLGSLTALGLLLGTLLGVAARYLAVEDDPLEAELGELLPGTQCGQCGYAGCSQAAAALARGEAQATLCPPGGRALVEALANKLGVEANADAGKTPVIAYVVEALCIGCTKCFKRCPTDAIVGGPKMIHAIFPEACTGCEQCFDVCPTECIELRPVETTLATWHWPKPVAGVEAAA
jgi:electron transport complex protein RnfB